MFKDNNQQSTLNKQMCWLLCLICWNVEEIYNSFPFWHRHNSRDFSTGLIRYLITSTKSIVQELPDKLANDLRLRILRNIGQFSKMGEGRAQYRSLPSRNKTLVLVVKNEAKTDIRVFLSCPILLDFINFFPRL